MSLRPGDAVGNYRVLSRIGVGGMGAVYLAEHPLIGKKVALKVIHGGLAANREILGRFYNEARAVGAIGHEHIVDIHDFGQTYSGEYFFSMEYLDGVTLAAVLAREGALTANRSVHVAAQIASALGAAHACSIIHRDLKPDNVMLIERQGDRDYVKVLDFGLAKMFAESGQPITARGVVLGTPQYMSPEACEGRAAVDSRADVYSLGVLLFQMTTGQLPFDGDSMREIMVQQVSRPPPMPRECNPNIPPALEQIILRCMAKSPVARFETMAELCRALRDPEGYWANPPAIAMPAADRIYARMATANQLGPPRRTYKTAAVAGFAAFALAGLIAAIALPEQPSAAASDASVSIARSASADARSIAASPLPTSLVDAGSADEREATPRTAQIALATIPPGAEVADASGTVLGTTPTVISLPRDEREHVLWFRHPKAHDLKKTVVASGDSELELELQLLDNARAGEAKSHRSRRSKKRKRKKRRERRKGAEILRPDF